jgi:hypothetical protein
VGHPNPVSGNASRHPQLDIYVTRLGVGLDARPALAGKRKAKTTLQAIDSGEPVDIHTGKRAKPSSKSG